MSQENQIPLEDFSILEKLCRTFNFFLPREAGFIPIPDEIVTLDFADLSNFSTKWELEPVAENETVLGYLTDGERNIFHIELIVAENINLFNEKYKEKFSTVADSDNYEVFKLHYEKSISDLFSNVLVLIGNILSRNIYLRLIKAEIALEGNFSIREDFCITNTPIVEQEQPQAPLFFLVPASAMGELGLEESEELSLEEFGLEEPEDSDLEEFGLEDLDLEKDPPPTVQ